MNREQAKAILANIELIRHFANGGEIGYMRSNGRGEYIGTTLERSIVVSHLHAHPDLTRYVRLKPRMVYSQVTGRCEPSPRLWLKAIGKHEIMGGRRG